jgi:UDP-N-acetylglucosamine acyltransferase
MAVAIHPTALVSPKAEIDIDVQVGPFAIVENDVVVGRRSTIGPRTLLASGTRLGENVQVHNGAVLGTAPQDLKFANEQTTLSVGDNTVIREFATLNRGTANLRETRIGRDCFLMAYTHVAHDCVVGNNVIMANSVHLAGHTEIGDFAVIGGVVPVHQFVRIGEHSIIGGGFRVPMDVCPYSLCGGYPLRVVGLNIIGLRRRGFAPAVITTLQRVFRILFRSKLNTSQAVARIKAEIEPIPEVAKILSVIEHSRRGICK